MPHQNPSQAEPVDQSRTEAAYSRWAPVYDLIFDLPFHPGRSAAARAANEATPPNGEMLVVGVGTGLELRLLSSAARITGIDLSQPMLKVARERVARLGLRQVKALQQMDATALEFAPASFDVALAPFVMSVVPDPRRVLDEMWRVLKPGGEIVSVNHFSADSGVRAQIEAAMEKSAGWLGWHPQFPYAQVGDWIAATPDAKLLERREIAPLRLFTLLRIGKRA